MTTLDLSAIDVRAEIEAFDWRSARWQTEKLIAASPFRDDVHPSFYVYFEDTGTAQAGAWGDSGTGERGGIVKLLAYLRNETEADTLVYLREKYGLGDEHAYGERFTIKPLQLRPTSVREVDTSVLDGFTGDCPYVTQRGVSDRIARLMDVRQRGSTVAFPWYDAKDRLRAVKFRSTVNKAFWYAKGGEDIRNLLYGINVVLRYKSRQVALVEGEIDALYLMTAGVPAVATGSAGMMNERKAELLAGSSAEEVVIFPDNDEAGERMKRKAIDLLRRYGHLSVRVAEYPKEYKDANDVEETSKLMEYINKSKYVGKIYKIL